MTYNASRPHRHGGEASVTYRPIADPKVTCVLRELYEFCEPTLHYRDHERGVKAREEAAKLLQQLELTPDVTTEKLADYHEWAAKQTAAPMSDERLAEYLGLAWKHGPGSCWTGTLGTLAAAVIELVREVARLRREAT